MTSRRPWRSPTGSSGAPIEICSVYVRFGKLRRRATLRLLLQLKISTTMAAASVSRRRLPETARKPFLQLPDRFSLPPRRRLCLDPSNKLYFPYEPGTQARSATRLKNTSKSHVAFKFQTTAPKSCFMRPPGGILASGESIIATVFKFVERPENDEVQVDLKCKVKFKITSLKVTAGVDYLPELFDEQRDQVTVERILRVVFLDVGDLALHWTNLSVS